MVDKRIRGVVVTVRDAGVLTADIVRRVLRYGRGSGWEFAHFDLIMVRKAPNGLIESTIDNVKAFDQVARKLPFDDVLFFDGNCRVSDENNRRLDKGRNSLDSAAIFFDERHHRVRFVKQHYLFSDPLIVLFDLLPPEGEDCRVMPA